ncbi:MAG: molybdopterin-dependent oxidoreductase [Acidobacteria bacterium]|nr:molybdopterin-dependent oxidoreductase [Acidobacteriota bacterium]
MGRKTRKESRRVFLQGVALGGGLLALDSPIVSAQPAPGVRSDPQSPDFTRQSAALAPDRVVASACQFCNSLCRLQVHLKRGRVIDVRGDASDPVQAGNLCVKAGMMTELVYNRFRLKHPLRRTSGEKGSPDSKFEPVSWEEALDLIAGKFLALRDEGQARTIANRTTGRMLRGTGSLAGRFFTLLGSPNDTDVGPVCNDAGGNALAWTFGIGNFTNGYGRDEITGREDLGSAKYLLFLGTNQAETHPVTFAHLLRERAKTRAKLTVVDPRRTPTAAEADLWIAPKPHTDMALALAWIYHIIAKNLYDRRFVAEWVVGFEELKRHVIERGYTPQWAAEVTGVPAAMIVRTAEEYARARPAAIFCNAGISHQMSAFDTYRALAFLAAITGNIGVPGGGCNFMHNTWPGDLRLPPIKGETPVKDAALPVGPDTFAESILTGRPYRLRAIVTSGNPILACANTTRVREAYRQLEFHVYTGLFMEEAAYYADVILPVTSGFEMEGVYMRRDDRAIRWQQQAVARVGEARTDVEIWMDLAQACARRDKRRGAAYWTDNFPLEWRDYRKLWETFVAHTPGMGGMTAERLEARSEPLRWPCPSTAHPGVSTLYLDHRSWYEAVESLDPRNRGKRFPTPGGKVEIHTEALDRKLMESGHRSLPEFYTHPEATGGHPALESTAELVNNPVNPQALTPKMRRVEGVRRDVHREFPLMGIIGRASVVHFTGVTQWTPTGKRMNGVRLIQIHPRAAAGAGIADGDEVVVESPRGAIRGTALLWEGMREDTIFVPNSFGDRQQLAAEFDLPSYEPANVLIDDRYYDNLSGQQAYKCFACRVGKAV